MAKKQTSSENAESVVSVKITKGCIYAEGTIQELDPYTAQHIINMGYGEISSGESGQEDQDTAKD